jgi:hypothetical protein
MSYYFTVFIGPYAEWRVRLGKKAPRALEDLENEPWYESLRGALRLAFHDDGSDLPEVKVGRVRYAQYRFWPGAERRDRPPRTMALPKGYGNGEDWSWINPRAELDWFSEAFASELATLATHFGAPPTLRWGPLFDG